ncbi:MAG: hypothetical protein QM749_04325 [Aquabacterium sp.]
MRQLKGQKPEPKRLQARRRAARRACADWLPSSLAAFKADTFKREADGRLVTS